MAQITVSAPSVAAESRRTMAVFFRWPPGEATVIFLNLLPSLLAASRLRLVQISAAYLGGI
jgi:hypothetical protein